MLHGLRQNRKNETKLSRKRELRLLRSGTRKGKHLKTRSTIRKPDRFMKKPVTAAIWEAATIWAHFIVMAKVWLGIMVRRVCFFKKPVKEAIQKVAAILVCFMITAKG